jgi:hypothetical protein
MFGLDLTALAREHGLALDPWGFPVRDLPDGRRLTLQPCHPGLCRVGVSPTSDNLAFSHVF